MKTHHLIVYTPVELEHTHPALTLLAKTCKTELLAEQKKLGLEPLAEFVMVEHGIAKDAEQKEQAAYTAFAFAGDGSRMFERLRAHLRNLTFPTKKNSVALLREGDEVPEPIRTRLERPLAELVAAHREGRKPNLDAFPFLGKPNPAVAVEAPPTYGLN